MYEGLSNDDVGAARGTAFQEIRPWAGLKTGDFVEEKLGARATVERLKRRVSRTRTEACQRNEATVGRGCPNSTRYCSRMGAARGFEGHPTGGIAVVGFTNNVSVRLSSSSEELPVSH